MFREWARLNAGCDVLDATNVNGWEGWEKMREKKDKKAITKEKRLGRLGCRVVVIAGNKGGVNATRPKQAIILTLGGHRGMG